LKKPRSHSQTNMIIQFQFHALEVQSFSKTSNLQTQILKFAKWITLKVKNNSKEHNIVNLVVWKMKIFSRMNQNLDNSRSFLNQNKIWWILLFLKNYKNNRNRQNTLGERQGDVAHQCFKIEVWLPLFKIILHFLSKNQHVGKNKFYNKTINLFHKFKLFNLQEWLRKDHCHRL